VERFATVRCADGIFKLGNFLRRHSLNQTPSPRSFQFLLPLRVCMQIPTPPTIPDRDFATKPNLRHPN
jgi:hypothetical protein